jgi:hypothetical protein
MYSAFQLVEVQLKMCCVYLYRFLTEYFRLFPKYIRQNYIKGLPTVLLGELTFCGSGNEGYALCMDAGSSERASFTCTDHI